MRRIAMLAGLTLAAAVLTGCPPAYPKCENDSQCQEKGEVCVQGTCQECANDTQCKEGFSCQGNKCAPKPPECTRDEACGAGRICEGNKCAAAQCQEDSGCKGGQQCQKGRCVAREPGTCAGDADCKEGESCQANRCVAAAPRQCDWQPVRFEFNEATLTAETQSRLKELVECLREAKGSITLAGHADERGTEEYNLQLSQKRAESVKRYLVDLGVSAGTLQPVGYGENKPASAASNEEAWATNRRVEFVR